MSFARSWATRVAVFCVLAASPGCKQDGPPPPSGAPAARGAPPPPPADSAAKPGACKGGGGEVKDAVSAAFFARTVAGFCVNPEGETQAFGERAPKGIEGICSLFDGGCEVYRAHQVKRTVSVDYVDGSGSPGTVSAILSQFASPEHAFAMYTRRVTSEEDPARPDMPRKAELGAPAALGSSSLYACKGPYLLELSYVNTDESGDEKRMRASAEKILPQVGKAIVEKLSGSSQELAAVAALPRENQLPLGVSYGLQSALGAEGTGPFATGFYRQEGKRYRVVALVKDDPDQARDVLRSMAKKKGATEEKGVGEAAARLMVQEQPDGPRAEWVVARKGKLVVGIGDEPFALQAGQSAAEHEKVSLSRDEKLKRLKALVDASK